MTSLKGMTWSHPRGYDPMVATSKEWAKHTGVSIDWDKRSLHDFESYPVEELAREYDLIVIDHPHVGQITELGCLAPLDVPGREVEREALASASVGESYASYYYAGHQWAFPIDAAAQVLAYRADLIEPPKDWRAVVDLAKAGRVALPLKAPHALMSFFTITANFGGPCATEGAPLVERAIGALAIEMLTEVTAHIDRSCFEMDPIDAYEAVVRSNGKLAVVPLGYGYVNYSINGFRSHRLAFTDIPLPDAKGSTLGGTGIAVSAFSRKVNTAVDFAYWVASEQVQQGLYAASGGQAGHGSAWRDDTVNHAAGDFYRNTLATLERSYVRPRFDGYMSFQDAGSRVLADGLIERRPASAILADIESLFEKALASKR